MSACAKSRARRGAPARRADDDAQPDIDGDARGRSAADQTVPQDPLPRRPGNVVVGATSHLGCHDLLLPVRACPRHRTRAGKPAGLQRGRRDLQDTDRRPDGGRSGGRGALSRAQWNPGDLDRFVVGGSTPPAADAVDRRRRLRGGSGGRADRVGCAHGGAFPMSAPGGRRGSPAAPVLLRFYDRPAGLDNPRAPRRRTGMPNFEKHAWMFMRLSGIVLVFLALGHLFMMLMWQNGVYRIDFNYVAVRWHLPFWQTWDLLLLWLAQLHGANGMRTIIADYARKDWTRFWLTRLLAVSTIFTIVLGTYVLLTFNPNIS